MFDLLRNLPKSEADKRQEAITAYLDDELTAGERQHLEQQMAADPDLRVAMEEQRLVKVNINRLPRARAPRNFTLDPALYGRRARQNNARLYPAMRVATVLVGVFFIIAVGAEILNFGGSQQGFDGVADQTIALAPAAEVQPESEEGPASESALILESEPQVGRDGESFTSDSEEVVAEELLEEAPLEMAAAAADGDLVESEVAAEESAVETIVTAVAEAEAQKNMTGESPVESAPRAATPVDELYDDEGAQPAPVTEEGSGLPSGGGGVPEEPPLADVLPTVATGRSMPTATVDALPTEEAVAEALEQAEETAPEALPVEAPPVESRDDRGDLPPLQLTIFLLGIIFVLLVVITLFTRWQLNR